MSSKEQEQEQKEVMTMVETILVQFDSTIRAQQEMNRQMNRRTSRIVFLGSLAIVALFAGVAFLNWSLMQNMEAMSAYMKKTATEVSAINTTMEHTQNSMQLVQQDISQIAAYSQLQSVPVVQSNDYGEFLSQISDSVKLMHTETNGINKNITNLNYNLNSINKQIKNLNRSLRFMSQDANRMPSPTRMFPF